MYFMRGGVAKISTETWSPAAGLYVGALPPRPRSISAKMMGPSVYRDGLIDDILGGGVGAASK